MNKKLNTNPNGSNNNWSFSGGHLEFGEPEEANIREVAEETNIRIKSYSKFHFTNDQYSNGSQYITPFFKIDQFEDVPVNLEPKKCEGWICCNPNKLPETLCFHFSTLYCWILRSSFLFVNKLFKITSEAASLKSIPE